MGEAAPDVGEDNDVDEPEEDENNGQAQKATQGQVCRHAALWTGGQPGAVLGLAGECLTKAACRQTRAK